MGFFCRIYVDKQEIYSGHFEEVPEKFRQNIKDDLSQWADSLGQRGLNELIYSHFVWYEKKEMYCDRCEKWNGVKKTCVVCGNNARGRFFYERNDRIELIQACIGMITRIEVLN